MEASDFSRIGGLEVLSQIMDEFTRRVFADAMIGFHFRKASRERVTRMETQFAARMLGGEGIAYEGMSIREAHQKHPIMGGQFLRRQKILEETLIDAGVAEDIIRRWLEHNERLRPMVTRDRGGECTQPGEQRSGIRIHSSD